MPRRPRASRKAAAAAALAIPAATAEAIASSDELRYSSDTEAGITRRRAGAGFYYVGLDGKRVLKHLFLHAHR